MRFVQPIDPQLLNAMSDEDYLFPVYCTSCRAHISRAASNAQNGLCLGCQSMTQTVQVPAMVQPAPLVFDAPMYSVQAFCPNCRQGPIRDVFKYQAGTKDLMFAFALGSFVAGICCMFWLWAFTVMFIIVGICIPSRPYASGRECLACGHRWSI